jgi:hypothetical protein
MIEFMNKTNEVLGWSWMVGALTAALWLLPGCAVGKQGVPGEAPAFGRAPGFLHRTNYQGWPDSIWLSNGKVEAIIVPAIGRVMQFRFAGEDDGPFWENPELFGQSPDPDSGTWLNFGGDRTWPSPESTWRTVLSTNWPPPPGFDATPVEARINGWAVDLIYPVDDAFGIQVTRHIRLATDAPVMEITTRYDKVAPPTLDAGIWVITQLKEPLAVYARQPLLSVYPQGFLPMSDRVPPTLTIRDRLLSLGRDPEQSHRIGLDVGSLLWVSDDTVLRIDCPRLLYRSYPDEGASAAVRTNPDPLAYVELELLAPVVQLRVGDVLEKRSTYTLLRRTEVDPDLEAARLLRP